MSINFSGVQSMTIPEGVATKITDATGRILWQAVSGKVVLEVEKITSNTYAGETQYKNEQFVLLDIYPKTNGTVTVTYGGLSKTIIDTSGAEEPNAQQVFFGTFNGVPDDVETPANGELTIEGDCYAFSCGEYSSSSSKTGGSYCWAITSIKSFGEITLIPATAFGNVWGNCMLKGDIHIPDTVRKIESQAFQGCANDGLSYPVVVGAGVENIAAYAFQLNKTARYESIKLLPVVPPTLTPDEDGKYASFGYIAINAESGAITTDTRPQKIIVPKGRGDAYRNAEGWTTYADIIEEAT